MGKSCTGAFQKLLKSIYVALMQFVPLLLCRTTIRWWLANTKNVPSPWRTRHGPCGLLATCKRAAYEMLYCWNTIWCSNGLPCRYASIPDEEFWAEWIVVFSYWPFGGKIPCHPVANRAVVDDEQTSMDYTYSRNVPSVLSLKKMLVLLMFTWLMKK